MAREPNHLDDGGDDTRENPFEENGFGKQPFYPG